LSVLDRRAPSLDEIELLAREAFAGLPEQFRKFTGDVVFMVQEFPDDEMLDEMEIESHYELLGLFQGPDLANRQSGYPDTTMIFLFRRPIIDYWAESDESLDHIVRHVLIHEIGHHFGLTDEQMEAIEERGEST